MKQHYPPTGQDLSAGNYMRMVQRLSTELPLFYLKNKKEADPVSKALLETLVDDDPDQSLSHTYRYPIPIFKKNICSGPILPERKWNEIRSMAQHWPQATQKLAPILFAGKDGPTWKDIKAFFSKLGFKPIPLRSYLGAPLYHYLISNRFSPVVTHWALRFKKQPYYYVTPIDVLHDLGHGLAMAMDDYREYAVEFSKRMIDSSMSRYTKETGDEYNRLFEFAHVLNAKTGRIEPIGSAPMTAEYFRIDFKDGQIHPPQRSPYYYRPYGHRSEWNADVEKFLKKVKANAKRKSP